MQVLSWGAFTFPFRLSSFVAELFVGPCLSCVRKGRPMRDLSAYFDVADVDTPRNLSPVIAVDAIQG